mmetsp:Transcript_20772/g.60427  ORF Transcript_20772/g.60427 Transcript_20772/m.60427 type:complete len:92 (-) Transcript_20772:1018-1293(-)
MSLVQSSYLMSLVNFISDSHSFQEKYLSQSPPETLCPSVIRNRISFERFLSHFIGHIPKQWLRLVRLEELTGAVRFLKVSLDVGKYMYHKR